MRSPLPFVAFACALAFGVAAAQPARAEADRKLLVVEPKHRLAQELLPVAQTLMRGQGEALLDPGGNALVLVGPKPALELAREALEALDRARPTVVVRWQTRRLHALLASGHRIEWSSGAARLRVGTLRGEDAPPAARASVRSLASERDGEGGGLLRILDGETGEIALGRTVPLRTWGGVAFATGATSLLAKPRLLGDGRIQVVLEPATGRVSDAGVTRFAEASTTLVLAPGETVVLGALGSARDFEAGAGRVLRSASSQREEIVLLVSATLD